MDAISIYTTCATTAEAHQLGQGITCALDGARVIAAFETTNTIGQRVMVVELEFQTEHTPHVCAILDADDRVVSYR